jgi:membrane protease YdiL (CAAX protease family)
MDNTPNFPPPNFEGENPRNDFGLTPNPAGQGMNPPFPSPLVYEIEPIDNAPLDPDNPRWGALAGIGVWCASVGALILASLVGIAVWFVIYKAKGGEIPLEAEAMNQLLMSPLSLLIQVIFTIVAHLITIAVCWAVATGMGKRPLKEAIGWNWDEPSPLKKVGIIVGTVVLSFAIFQILPRIIPNAKTTPFDEMLKVSPSIRYVIAFLAVFTAPLVEELVYRALLYSPLKRAMGAVAAIVTVTLVFALVHVLQYWGAWASLTGLLMLSLFLTVIRAKTKSIFPCVAIHTLFNAVGAIGILFGAGS